MRKIYFLSLLCLLCASGSLAQKNKKELQIGVKIINELSFEGDIAPGFGGQIVYKMGKHSGLESGLIYQTHYTSFYTYVQFGTISNNCFTKIAERRLQIPVLYRFNSRIINFSVGPVIDYFLGWKVKVKDPNVTVNSYDRDAVVLIGAAGISKSIYLSPSFILEPEIKFNQVLSYEDGGISLNIALRKRIR